MAGTDLQPGGESSTALKADLPGGLHPGPEAGHGGIGSRQRMGLLGAGPGPEGVRGEVKRARADGGKLGPKAGGGHLPGGIGGEGSAHLRRQCHLAGAMAECAPEAQPLGGLDRCIGHHRGEGGLHLAIAGADGFAAGGLPGLGRRADLGIGRGMISVSA